MHKFFPEEGEQQLAQQAQVNNVFEAGPRSAYIGLISCTKLLREKQPGLPSRNPLHPELQIDTGAGDASCCCGTSCKFVQTL